MPEGSAVNETLAAAAARYAELLRATLGDSLVSVALFGSVARGEAHADSDLDLLVVCETLPAGRFARLRVLEPAERAFQHDLDRLDGQGVRTRLSLVVKTRDEAQRVVPLYLDLVEDARLLHDRGGFFAGVLERLRASLARHGAERRRLGRVRYWVLKRDFRPGEVVEL
ncbi:MAG: nucleotidyltransferase domain-containing protein [Candidatus Rokuibacteriota bacterium]